MNRGTSITGDDTRRAVFAILAAVLALSLGDALVKALSVGLPLWQLFVLRGLVAVPLLVVFIRWRQASTTLFPGQPYWVALRSLLLTGQWVAYYAALPVVDLSVAAAAYYTLPLFITLFAPTLTGERIGVAGTMAVALGFSGVLVMLRPGTAGFTTYALLPLLAAVLYALAMVMTRSKCAKEDPLVLALSLHLCLLVTGLFATGLLAVLPESLPVMAGNRFLAGDWVAMDATGWLAIAGLAAAALVGAVGGAVAYQLGPPATVATFDYFYLALVTVWGLIFFNEVPDGWTLAGIALIVVAGLLVTRSK